METKDLWIRLGVVFQITPKEEAAIFSNSDHLPSTINELSLGAATD